jgi:hypothetical protein
MYSISSRLGLPLCSRGQTLVLVLVGALFWGGAGEVRAQSPVSTVKDNQGNDLMQIFDNGDLELFQNGKLTTPGMIESTSGGFLLPDGTLLDESGDLGSSFSLPFSGSASTGPVFEIENTGTGDGIAVTGAGDDGFRAENVSYGLFVPGADVTGVLVSGDKDGIVAEGDVDDDGSGLAGAFIGDVDVSQTLSAATKNFKIDHPQDPTSKYLQHTTVESPKMLNVYSGNVTLNASGEATVQLPDYFEAANTNYRYQLTAIGAPGPNLHIAAEISNNQFRIAGGDSNMKVSWRVTGVRNDPYAQQNRVQAEVQKPASKQGTYRHPEAYGAPESQGEAAIEKKQDREEVRSLKQKEKTPAEKDKQEKKKEQGQ